MSNPLLAPQICVPKATALSGGRLAHEPYGSLKRNIGHHTCEQCLLAVHRDNHAAGLFDVRNLSRILHGFAASLRVAADKSRSKEKFASVPRMQTMSLRAGSKTFEEGGFPMKMAEHSDWQRILKEGYLSLYGVKSKDQECLGGN